MEGKGTDGLTDRRARENNNQHDPTHPLATRILSKECQLLNSIPTLESY